MTPQPDDKGTDSRTITDLPTKTPHAVLAVDDEANIRSALKRALHGEPYELVVADSGARALELLKDRSIQVVVSDLSMPEMDGMTLLAKVAERAPHVIRLILSGRSDSQDILKAINDGSIYRYILKPWANDNLRIVIRQALALWDLQTEKEALLVALQVHTEHLEELVDQRTQQVLAVERQADIGRYASQIVHNLSNPLHVLHGAIQMLETYAAGEQTRYPKKQKLLAIARSASDDLREIVAGILSHAHQSDQYSLSPLDINKVIGEQIDFFNMIPDFKYKIEKELLLDETIPPIQGNPIQIKQILGNLIKNAVDAMEETSVKRLTLETSLEEDQIVIRVSDTGKGIPEANVEKIFSSDFTTKPVGKGTGLGLASVKAMVEAYAGSIQVASTLDQGTTFHLRLPAIVEGANTTPF